jgi:hypothetical protein
MLLKKSGWWILVSRECYCWIWLALPIDQRDVWGTLTAWLQWPVWYRRLPHEKALGRLPTKASWLQIRPICPLAFCPRHDLPRGIGNNYTWIQEYKFYSAKWHDIMHKKFKLMFG